MNEQRPRLLCVDDDTAVLDGLALTLRRSFDVTIADSAAEALRRLDAQDYPIVMSDMRMPQMSGAELLAEVRKRHPDSVRLLLTGYADMEAAASAVNEGQVFRFLIKPCTPPVLLRALQDAVTQYRLITAERELLERTLRGTVQALAEVLSLADAVAYGHAISVQKLALALARQLGLIPIWPLELAALLAPLGRVSLPPEIHHKEQRGDPLTTSERAALAKVAEVTQGLLAPIPRLEPVRSVLFAATRSVVDDALQGPDERHWQRCGRVLRLATDYVDRESRGDSVGIALAEMRARHVDQPELLAALEKLKGAEADHVEIRSLPVRLLQAGMVLCDDLYTQAGQRLVPRGFTVNAGLVERIRNLRAGSLREPVRVSLLRAPASTSTAP
ncbi:response regulator [Hydrocarboniphaga effusa]|uniref:response regulator n=1 Tax=Hydrocarboniphaga effusa TaxID=243629 RepID=UPI00398BE06D